MDLDSKEYQTKRNVFRYEIQHNINRKFIAFEIISDWFKFRQIVFFFRQSNGLHERYQWIYTYL